MDLTNINKDRKARRKESLDLSTIVYGKVPPQSKNLEEVVLGAIMLEKGALDIVLEILRPECFYVDAHQRMFRAMVSLQSKHIPIDIMTVVEELKIREELEIVGGPYYVMKLTNSVVSAANIEAHARIILQNFLKREIIRIGGESINDAYADGTDVFDLIDELERQVTELTSTNLQKDYADIETVTVAQMTRIESLRTSREELTGVPSGYRDLDAKTYGWQNTDLIILAARPSVGKTAFALNLARNAALNKSKPIPVGFFSLEMSAGQLVNRILAAESEIYLEKIQRGKLDDHEMRTLYRSVSEKIIKSRIKIDDTAALNIMTLRAKARRMVRKHRVGMIIIDYLQLMTGSEKNGNREQEISKISRELKGLAKELEVPVIALSQLSREVEKRQGDKKMPQLSDLRESGAIEQDADVVMFLYRPEYYDQNHDAMGDSTKGETHLKIAKHRNGDLGTITLRADLAIQKFYDAESNYSSFSRRTTLPGHGPGNWAPVESRESKENSSDTPF